MLAIEFPWNAFINSCIVFLPYSIQIPLPKIKKIYTLTLKKGAYPGHEHKLHNQPVRGECSQIIWQLVLVGGGSFLQVLLARSKSKGHFFKKAPTLSKTKKGWGHRQADSKVQNTKFPSYVVHNYRKPMFYSRPDFFFFFFFFCC